MRVFTSGGVLAAVAVFFLVGLLPAGSIYWSGGAGGAGTSWNDTANWSGGALPGTIDEG